MNAFVEWIEAPAPDVTAQEAQFLAATHFGIQANAHGLYGERDRNFRLEGIGGVRGVAEGERAGDPAGGDRARGVGGDGDRARSRATGPASDSRVSTSSPLLATAWTWTPRRRAWATASKAPGERRPRGGDTRAQTATRSPWRSGPSGGEP